MASKHAHSDLRIVLVGKTGVGKSAAGNTILRRFQPKVFNSQLSTSSQTSVCQKETAEFEGHRLAVVDTPGLFDTKRPEDQVIAEIAKCISFVAPGPHVFLVVLQLNRFTKEEQDTVKIIQTLFGEKSAKYTMVLFTNGDALEIEGITIEKFISKNEVLKGIIQSCRGYHVFNNTNQDPSQVRKLLKKIDSFVTLNGQSYYTNDMLKEAERAIQEELKHAPEKTREMAEKDNSFIKSPVFKTVIKALLQAVVAVLQGPVVSAVGAAVGAVVGSAVESAATALKKNACPMQ